MSAILGFKTTAYSGDLLKHVAMRHAARLLKKMHRHKKSIKYNELTP